MQRHDWSSTSPKEHMSHLSLSPCTGYQLQLASSSRLMLAYKTTTGSAPTYFHSLLQIYTPSRSLRSASERCLVVPSQRGSKSLSRSISLTILGWWNDLTHPHPEFWIPVNLQATTENSSLSTLLDKKYISLPFSPSLASLYLFEQCLRLGVRGTSSVCLPLKD